RRNLPRVIDILKSEGVAIPANHLEVYGWLPPPLVREGRKVEPAWLHSFLLNPYPIRPAAVLRMPKFNMSSHEAEKLVNYFAAVDSVDFPYEFNPRQQPDRLKVTSDEHPKRLTEALNLIVDANICV